MTARTRRTLTGVLIAALVGLGAALIDATANGLLPHLSLLTGWVAIGGLISALLLHLGRGEDHRG